MQRNFKRAVITTILSAFGFAMMTFCVRESGDIPVMQKAFFRNAVAAVIAATDIVRKKVSPFPKSENRTDMLGRLLFGTAGLLANFWAIDHLLLADANLLNKTSPLFAILLSIPLLHEYPTKADTILTIIGLIGTAFVVKPTAGLASLPALVALFGGFGAGAAYTFVRRMSGKGENGATIVFDFSLFSTLCCLPFMFIEPFHITVTQLLWLIGAGSFAALGQFMVTAAYKYAPASDVSVFNYSQILFAALLGFLFFHELPDLYSWIGYAIIIVSAFIKWLLTRKYE